VLRSALEEKLNLRLFNIDHEDVVVDVTSSPESEDGYLCHRRSHWFALRSIGGLWFSVDSRLSRPRLISDETLRAFLMNLKASRGSAFVLRPAPVLDVLAELGDDSGPFKLSRRSSRSGCQTLPPPKQPSRGLRHGHGDVGDERLWYPIDTVIAESCSGDPYPPERIGAPIGDDDESAAAAAAAACMQADEDSDAMLALQIAQAEAEAASSETAWRMRRTEMEAAQQPGPVTSRSRALLTSLGTAISRPFTALGGAGGPVQAHIAQQGFKPPMGTTGWSGGPPPPPPPAKGWEVHVAADGRPYYHNRATGATTWDPPLESPNGKNLCAPSEYGVGGAAASENSQQPPGSNLAQMPSTVPGAAARPLPPGFPPSLPPSPAGSGGGSALQRPPHIAPLGERGIDGIPSPPAERVSNHDQDASLAWALEQSHAQGRGAPSWDEGRLEGQQRVVAQSPNAVWPGSSQDDDDADLAWALAESLKMNGGVAVGRAKDGGGSLASGKFLSESGANSESVAEPLIVLGPD